MKTHPFLTILTASLNNGATIRHTLESVRKQHFKNLEHIVIDGGSCDETLNILEEFESAHNLFWMSEPDEGIADALNKGFRKALGRYILVLQADDQLMSPNILESFYSVLINEGSDIYSCPVILDHPIKGKILVKPIKILWWYHFKTIFPHQGSLVHRRVFERIGEFRNEFSIAMDYDFFYRSLKYGSTVKFGNLPLSLMGGTGISCDKNLLKTRLKEESLVQALNEKSLYWRSAQMLFRLLYTPYKTQFLPILSRIC
jgi:glycosyltransferase involved in cell wall biosynthesis